MWGAFARQVNVRSNYGVEVILIKRSKKEGREAAIVPPADDPIEHGDVLLVAGRRDQIKQLAV